MDIFQNLIAVLNKEEIRNFKLFINRTEKKEDRKDELLFDYTKQHLDNYNETKIAKQLYGQRDKNAFYRLKNRLVEDIGKSLLLQHSKSSDFNLIANQVLLSKIFTQKRNYKIAAYYLIKAERKALEKEYVDWLDIIYTDFIKLSHETLDINPEDYINKRKQNRNKLVKLQEIDDILAALIYRIKVSQNYSTSDTQVLDVLQKTVDEFSKNKEVRSSPALRFKIYDSLSRILLQQQNYQALEKYLVKTYKEFSKEKLFNQANHDTKLQLLTYLINSLFKNGKHDESLSYANVLLEAMAEYGSMLKDKYLFYYYNSLVINYSVKDSDKAIEILQEAKENTVIQKLPMYNVFVYLNLSVLYFGKKRFKDALKNLVKPLLEDAYSNLDEAFRLKLSVYELIIRFELEDTDYLERKIDSVTKEYKQLLKRMEYKQQQSMVMMIRSMVLSDNFKKDKKILALAKKLMDDTIQNESNIVNYGNWIKNKFSL